MTTTAHKPAERRDPAQRRVDPAQRRVDPAQRRADTAQRRAETVARRRARTAARNRQFERGGDGDRLVEAGYRLPSAVLLEADLGPIHLDRLRLTGPIVLVFFRHASSVSGAAALADYQKRLAPELAAADVHLVAVSPQIPAKLAELKRRLDLSYFVAADVRHALIDHFGLGVQTPGSAHLLGTSNAVLPLPSVLIADRTGRIRYADVRADGAPHPDAADIRTAVHSL
jgi:peroxiredoxin